METAQSRYAHLRVQQTDYSLVKYIYIVPHPLEELLRNDDSTQEVDTTDEESAVARIPELFTFIIRNKKERAEMAQPLKQSIQVLKGKSVIVMYCSA